MQAPATVEQIATPEEIAQNQARALDWLTSRFTAFSTFAALLAGGEAGGHPAPSSYFPSLYPQPYCSPAERRGLRALADAYDAAQAARGDARRCYRGQPEWWRPAVPRSLRRIRAAA